MALANKLTSELAAVFPTHLFSAGLACTLPFVVLIGLHFSPSVPAASMHVRGTLPWHNFLSGPTAWDEKDYERYLDRMQALGLNYVAFHCYTGGAERYAPYVEPLIRIEYRNILPEASLDTSLTARWGYRPLAIPDFAFGTDRLFPRPHGARAFGARAAVTARNNEERYALSQRQMRRVIQMAHDRGIQVAIGFEFGIQPLEFWSAVPPGAYISGAGIPDPTHPAAIEILRHTLDNLLGTYPDLDWIWLWLHEHTMYVGKSNYSQGLKAMLDREGHLFPPAGGDAGTFTGVWSLAYIRAAYDYVKLKSPRTRMAISGWGGGNQLTGVLLGLDQALPKDIVFTCLNPSMGLEPPPDFMATIAKNRDVWAIPWLEGDDALWHLQPRASLMLEQVKSARKQSLDGVLAIHWRTEETRANLEAFARAAQDPDAAPTAGEFYRQDSARQFGAAGERIAPILDRLDQTRGWRLASPEYFSYEPSWGRMNAAQRDQWSRDLADIRTAAAMAGTKTQRDNVAWLAAAFEFALLLDEVGRDIEPAYRLKQLCLQDRVSAGELAQAIKDVRASFQAAPIERLFRVYASRVRSRGELGVLSSINQKLGLEYRELKEFLDAYSTRSSQADPGSRAMGQAPSDPRNSRPNTSSRTAGE